MQDGYWYIKVNETAGFSGSYVSQDGYKNESIWIGGMDTAKTYPTKQRAQFIADWLYRNRDFPLGFEVVFVSDDKKARMID